jgi:hypothetical protein
MSFFTSHFLATWEQILSLLDGLLYLTRCVTCCIRIYQAQAFERHPTLTEPNNRGRLSRLAKKEISRLLHPFLFIQTMCCPDSSAPVSMFFLHRPILNRRPMHRQTQNAYFRRNCTLALACVGNVYKYVYIIEIENG